MWKFIRKKKARFLDRAFRLLTNPPFHVGLSVIWDMRKNRISLFAWFFEKYRKSAIYKGFRYVELLEITVKQSFKAFAVPCLVTYLLILMLLKRWFYAVSIIAAFPFAHHLPTRIFCPQIVVASVLWSYYSIFCRKMQEIYNYKFLIFLASFLMFW